MSDRNFPPRLTIAIPKQSKLRDPVQEFLRQRDLWLEGEGEIGRIQDLSGNIPDLRVEFVRAADALMLLERRVVALAVIGSDIVAEQLAGDKTVQPPVALRDLGVARCSFQLAVPEAQVDLYQTPASLQGKRIATSYPVLLQQWLQQNDVEPAEILVREGGVESSVRMGIADVVADLVDTGSTLKKNKLTATFNIFNTSAVCYTRPELSFGENLLAIEFMRRLETTYPAISQREAIPA